MVKSPDKTTIAFPHKPGHGGPGSFQIRFEKALKQEGFHIAYAVDATQPDLIFVVGGTKRLWWLIKMKIKGILVIHRLDGLAWLHLKKGLRTRLYGEWGNFLFKIIHGFFATHVVYQSQFVKKWWEKSGWRKPHSSSIIYNGVDLNEFKPITNLNKPINLLCVEGTLDYSPYAIGLLNFLQEKLIEKSQYQSLILYGGFQDSKNEAKLHPSIDYRGKVAREKLPSIYKNAVYLSLDVNAACPNTVAEALACGLPVIGFDTGALKELVQNAGEIADFGANQWKLETPNFNNLVQAALKSLENWAQLSENALKVSKGNYSIDKVSSSYMAVIKSLLKA
jgi:glycosyltransferase involved in cell wall biosynthesis